MSSSSLFLRRLSSSTTTAALLTLSSLAGVAQALLWSASPAAYGDIIRQAYPVGNGKLGVLPFGEAGAEKLSLNVDSLWSGGPFEVSNYTGGNPTEEKYQYLPEYRQTIFQNGTGSIDELLGSNDFYGSYRVLGNVSVAVAGLTEISGYSRSINFETGVHTTTFSASDGNTYTSTVYCSFPDQVCVYTLRSAVSADLSSGGLPDVTVSFENQQATSAPQNATCGAGHVRFAGLTQAGPPEGMKYDAIARVVGPNSNGTICSNSTAGALVIPSGSSSNPLQIVIAADTNYDQKKGNAESGYSFKGEDPGPKVEAAISAAAALATNSSVLFNRHVEDYRNLAAAFTLELPDTQSSNGRETSQLIAQYQDAEDEGDPFLELQLFEYSRHLLISSARPGALPANLQGKWSQTLTGAWSVDYHANINLQMNYWHADQTGLGELQAGLWDYMEDTWVPRGSETAQLLYDAPGWVTHDEMNIFGHTGMKSDAQWANYPASAAWMMQHVYDHFDYHGNTTWFAQQGYPLIRGAAAFWLAQLQDDAFFHDATLVANPCNSPEHGPTTFACTHYQQLVHQLLAYVLAARQQGIEADAAFAARARAALARLDTGLHLAAWGGVKEWKLPSSSLSGLDAPNDTHRHLSHLYGWYPGYSLSAPPSPFPLSNASSNYSSSSSSSSSAQPFHGGYANATIQAAVAASLRARGNGTGADADAGWAKVWRAACWARLNDTRNADAELRYALARNFAPNGLSMYSAHAAPFQIDANFGFAGAVLSMLVVDLPELFLGGEVDGDGTKRTVVLGPAIPRRWGGGRVEGLRLRGGGQVAFAWDAEGLVTEAAVTGRTRAVRVVNKAGNVLAEV